MVFDLVTIEERSVTEFFGHCEIETQCDGEIEIVAF